MYFKKIPVTFDDNLSQVIQVMTAINVKGIPDDLARFILRLQGQIKSQKCRGDVSQSQTVIYIIKEYKKLIEK